MSKVQEMVKDREAWCAANMESQRVRRDFFDCVDHNKLLKILKVMGIADTLSASLVAQMVKRLSTM